MLSRLSSNAIAVWDFSMEARRGKGGQKERSRNTKVSEMWSMSGQDMS